MSWFSGCLPQGCAACGRAVVIHKPLWDCCKSSTLRNRLLSPRLLRWGNAFNLSLKVPLAAPMCSDARGVFWERRVRILKACVQLLFWQAASAVLVNTREEQCSEHPCSAKPEKVSMEQIIVTFSIPNSSPLLWLCCLQTACGIQRQWSLPRWQEYCVL